MSECTEEFRTTDGFDRDNISRLLGCRDGFLHSLCAVEAMIDRYHGQYTGRFPARHTRKIRERDAIVKPMREIAELLREEMQEAMRVYQKNYDEFCAAQLSTDLSAGPTENFLPSSLPQSLPSVSKKPIP